VPRRQIPIRGSFYPLGEGRIEAGEGPAVLSASPASGARLPATGKKFAPRTCSVSLGEVCSEVELVPHSCRVTGCGQAVPRALAREALCLDHYLEQAFLRLQAALELCQQCRPVDPRMLDWLLTNADFAVQSLSQSGRAHSPSQRDKLLELLLRLTNLQEYLRHHSVQVQLTD
jgi:hypothetical protein